MEAMMSDVEQTIRKVLDVQGRLGDAALKFRDDDDLYRKGLTSHASVNVMLALEDEFDIEFSDTLLRRSTFGSIVAIRQALASLGVDTATTS
jgi:acyl carrier protein